MPSFIPALDATETATNEPSRFPSFELTEILSSKPSTIPTFYSSSHPSTAIATSQP